MDNADYLQNLTDSIDKLGALVLPILQSNVDDLVKLKAIELIKGFRVPPIYTVNGANITMSK